ncbi:MAG: hypothetical protein ABL930_12680, partial [Pseudobdellovibrio sp.]
TSKNFSETMALLGINEYPSVAKINKFIDIAKILNTYPDNKTHLDYKSLLNKNNRDIGKQLTNDWQRLSETAKSFSGLFDVNSSVDVNLIRKSASYLNNKSLFRWFNADYKQAKAFAKKFLLVDLKTVNGPELLNRIAQFLDSKIDFEKKLKNSRFISDNQINGMDTDFEGVNKWVTYYEAILDLNFDFVFSYESMYKILELDFETISKSKSSISKAQPIQFGELMDFVQSVQDDISLTPGLIEKVSIEFANESNKYLQGLITKFGAEKETQLKSLETSVNNQIHAINEDIAASQDILKLATELEISPLAEFKSSIEVPATISKISSIARKMKNEYLKFIVDEIPNLTTHYKNGDFANVSNFLMLTKDFNLSDEEFNLLLSSDTIQALNQFSSSLEKALKTNQEISKFLGKWKISKEWFNFVNVAELSNRINRALSDKNSASGYIDYTNSLNETAPFNDFLDSFLECSLDNPLILKNFYAAFKISFLDTIIKYHAKMSPAYFRSVSTTFEDYRTRFRKLDGEQLVAYRSHIIDKLNRVHVPPGVSKGKVAEKSELALIKHLAGQKRPKVAIRSLMERSGEAAQALKPVFLMSPLSVAQLLPDDHIQFDVVIMDEASQLRPEDAIGSIARAGQVIVVGDPKQMAPSDFFSRTGANITNPTDDSNFVDPNIESILDLGLTTFRPPRRLKWHYRSRSEELIAFSNKHFYESSLILFPSSRNSDLPLGVHYEFAVGVYNDGLNHIEA